MVVRRKNDSSKVLLKRVNKVDNGKTYAPKFCTEAYRIGLLTLLRLIPDYYSYHLQSGVISTPNHVPDYCSVVETAAKTGMKIATLRCNPV